MSISSSALIAVGLMSGTSMDGIDAALISTDGEEFVKELGNCSLEYEPEFKLLLRGCEWAVLHSKGNLDLARHDYSNLIIDYLNQSQSITHSKAVQLLADLSFSFHKKKDQPVIFEQVIERSTDLHAQLTQKLLAETNHPASSIDIIGYHGQTLYHRPCERITIQAGDGQRLADKTGITVAYDFRSNDVRDGGQGAPFAPLYHQALARQSQLVPLVVANCGGIANISVIGNGNEEIYAYDCGPGNNLVDRFVQLKVNKPMDLDGQYGSKGSVIDSVILALKAKAMIMANGSNYLDQKPPKSLDANDLALIPEVKVLKLEDGCATLEAFTAECIVDSLKFLPFHPPKRWILAGGGWKNKMIIAQLKERLKQKLGRDLRVEQADQVGWNSQSLEAQIFAYLAVRALRKLPLSLPSTTGVSKPLSGGKIVFPDGDLKTASPAVRSFFDKA